MAASLSALHNLIFKPLPTPSPFLFFKPISTLLLSHKPSYRLFSTPIFSTSTSTTYPDTPSSSSSSPLNLLSEHDHVEQDPQPQTPIKPSPSSSPPPSNIIQAHRAAKLPELTVKERKELASYAHSLGKKLKVQQVGKSGVTDTVAAAFVENLESNELLKLKIHNNCPGELPDVVKQLEEATGSVVVGQIGRTVILYRPSLTKLMAEEKKKQVQKNSFRRGFRGKSSEQAQKSGEDIRLSARGRRGKSRFDQS